MTLGVRRLIDVGTGIVQTAYEGREDVGSLLDQAEQQVFEVSHQRGTQEVVRIKELMWQAMERIEARHRGDDSLNALASCQPAEVADHMVIFTDTPRSAQFSAPLV